MMTELFPLLIPNQVKNTLREVAVILSQSTMKKYSHEFLKAKNGILFNGQVSHIISTQ